MVVEVLEGRRLLSFAFVAGKLTVTGTGGNDSITFKLSGRQLKLSDNGATRLFNLTAVQSIAVHARSGADLVTVSNDLRIKSTLFGEGGNDSLRGGGGRDLIDGGAGADQIGGGNNDDTVDYSARIQAIFVTIASGAGDGEAGEGDNVDSTIETVRGGMGADSITGDRDENLLLGGDGNDTLNGVGGDDTLDGQAGADSMSGGSGLDTITYASRSNGVTIEPGRQPDFGGNGEAGENDVILPDFETLIGGSGNDIIGQVSFPFVTLSDLRIEGGPGNDAIMGDVGDDTLLGGAGSDTIGHDAGNDLVDGGSGADLYVLHNVNEPGGGASVSLDNVANDGFGGEADNVLGTIENIVGSLGDDTLVGDNDNNIIEGFRGQDFIDGGGGNDSLTTFRSGAGGIGGGTLIGGAGNDTLGGTDTSNTFNEIHGGPGNDIIIADNSTTIMTGDSGSDSVNFNLRTTGGTFDFSAASFETIQGSNGSDHIIGGPGDEIFVGRKGDDTIEGNGGNDYIDGGIGFDLLAGGDGDDVFVNFEGLALEGNKDTVDGGNGFDVAEDGGFSNGDNPVPLDTLSNVEFIYDPENGAQPSQPLVISSRAMAVNLTVSASAVAVSNGVLNITGGSSADNISVILDSTGKNISVTQNGVSSTYAISGLTGIFIDSGGGKDVIALQRSDGSRACTLRATVAAGSGNDSVIGGANNDSLAGGSGNDTLNGASGNDVINGGSDTSTSSSDGADLIIGGSGNDSAIYSQRQDNLNIDLSVGNKSNDGATGEGDDVRTDIENVFSGNGDDAIVGNSASNLISGGGGKDTIKGGDGNDKLIGSRDHDLVLGQGGINIYSICDTGVDDFDGALDVGGRPLNTFISGDIGMDFSTASKRALG